MVLPHWIVDSPLVTIVTPSLNQAEYLERTLSSVLDQAYPSLEYFVLDGGSTDGSVEILERYDSRLSWWISEPDQGQASAINAGISRASGEIVAYINSDDFYLPGAIAAAAARFSDPTVEWVAGACRYEHPDGSIEAIVRPSQPSGGRAAWIRAPWYVPQASSFWRRSVFDRLGLLREDLNYVFDSEHALRLAVNGVLPAVIPMELAVRYLHEAAKSAEPARFQAEWREVQSEYESHLTARDHIHDIASRSIKSARHRASQILAAGRKKSPLI